MKKSVTFCKYNLKKWKKDEKYEKTSRLKKQTETVDMRDKNIEEELIMKHKEDYMNKKELCSHRMSGRDMVIQGLINPYMYNNDYVDDIKTQDSFLRPQDSNTKRKDNNKYLKMEQNNTVYGINDTK